MKKDEFYKRFLFVPIIVIVVSVLCIVFNGYARLFPENEEEIVAEDVDTVETAESKIPYKVVEKIKSGDGLIDINHASAEDFQKLPGIGSNKANSIVEQREKMGGFRTLNDFMCTEGIGPKIFENLKEFITITEYINK